MNFFRVLLSRHCHDSRDGASQPHAWTTAWFRFGYWIVAAIVISAGWGAVASEPRERISFNDNWRFTKGGPTNINTGNLLYDVRPVAKGADQKERLAEATEDAAKLAAATHPVLKPWILPTGNRFIKDPARRFVRPDGNQGGDPTSFESF